MARVENPGALRSADRRPGLVRLAHRVEDVFDADLGREVELRGTERLALESGCSQPLKYIECCHRSPVGEVDDGVGGREDDPPLKPRLGRASPNAFCHHG